jgi:hypothetical protein
MIGTHIYSNLLKQNRIIETNIGGLTEYIPLHMSYDELVRYTDDAKRKFYSKESVQKRCIKGRRDILEINIRRNNAMLNPN